MIDEDGPAIESGCNCRHLSDGARCYHCKLRDCRRGPGFMASDDDQDDDPDAVLLTDGGHPVTHECANCEAKYRDPKAADQCCVGDLLTDGGTRAPRSRPSSDDQDETSPAVVRALESRVDDVEDRVGEREDVAKDLVAIFNRLEDRVDELEQQVEDLGGEP